MWPFRREQPVPRGHVVLHADEHGALTGVVVESPLEPHEVGPVLDEAMRALAPRRAPGLERRLEQHRRELSKRAGMIDRLRGVTKEREAEALDVVGREIFEGFAGPVKVAVDGTLGYRTLSLHGAPTMEEAFAHLEAALEQACRACEARWEAALLGERPDNGAESG